jgi:hypothetical protein
VRCQAVQRIAAQISAVLHNLAPPVVHRGVEQDAVDHFGDKAFAACSKAKTPRVRCDPVP